MIGAGYYSKGWWDGAERYEYVNRNIIATIQRETMFKTLVRLAPGKVGFDIGGPGYIRYGDKVMGLNITEDANHLVADGSNLPLLDNCLDFIISSHALEHIIDTRKTLKEWSRVLKPNGIMGIVIPDVRFFEHEKEGVKETDLAPSEMTAMQFKELLDERDELEILFFDTHRNNFDCDVLARKKGE